MNSIPILTVLICLCGPTLQAFAQAESRPASSGSIDPNRDREPARADRAKSTPFEASKWVVSLTPDKEGATRGEKALEDVITFEGGKFSTHLGTRTGFEPAPFNTAASWAQVDLTSKDGHSKCAWRVEAAKDQLEGTLVTTRNEGTITKYRVEGRRAPSLEGTRWSIAIATETADGTKGTAKTMDTLAFAFGKFTTSSNVAGTAAPTAYTLTETAEGRKLSADTVDITGHHSLWSADFSATSVKGLLRTTDASGKEITHRFEGTLLGPESKVKGD